MSRSGATRRAHEPFTTNLDAQDAIDSVSATCVEAHERCIPGSALPAADIAGDGLSAAAALLPPAEVTVMANELGTVQTWRVLDALRADAWLHPRWRHRIKVAS
jgi:hypothetical protein